MTDQLDLFGPKPPAPRKPKFVLGPKPYELYDGTPPHEAPGTSHEAAVSVAPIANRLQQVVLDEIRASGSGGRTDDELEVRLNMKHQTVSARRRELYLLGKIRTVGKRRTRSGRNAQVWVVV